jgi:hypothetical protein
MPSHSIENLLRYRRSIAKAFRAWSLLKVHVWIRLAFAIRQAHHVVLDERFTGSSDVPRTFQEACVAFQEALREVSEFDEVPADSPWLWCGEQALTVTGCPPDIEGWIDSVRSIASDEWDKNVVQPFLTRAREATERLEQFFTRFEQRKDEVIAAAENRLETSLLVSQGIQQVLAEDFRREEEDRTQRRQRLHGLLTAALNSMSFTNETPEEWARRVTARLVSVRDGIQAQEWGEWARWTAKDDNFLREFAELLLGDDADQFGRVILALRRSPTELTLLGDWLKTLSHDWSIVFDRGWLWWTLNRDVGTPGIESTADGSGYMEATTGPEPPPGAGATEMQSRPAPADPTISWEPVNENTSGPSSPADLTPFLATPVTADAAQPTLRQRTPAESAVARLIEHSRGMSQGIRNWLRVEPAVGPPPPTGSEEACAASSLGTAAFAEHAIAAAEIMCEERDRNGSTSFRCSRWPIAAAAAITRLVVELEAVLRHYRLRHDADGGSLGLPYGLTFYPSDPPLPQVRLTALEVAIEMAAKEVGATLLPRIESQSELHPLQADQVPNPLSPGPVIAPPITSPDSPLRRPKGKRSTERGEGRVKIIAALTEHHRYAAGGCLNHEPIGNNALAAKAQVAPSTVSEFFKEQFRGHAQYRAVCRDRTRLLAVLKLLNEEFTPYQLFGRTPPGEGDRSEEK